MSRPKINLKTTGIDWILEAIALMGVLVTWLLAISNYSALPDTLPRHFNLEGQPDGFGSKSILFILPIVIIAVYAILTVAARFPHSFNYPYAITEENAERQYKNSTLMLRVLKVITVGMFLYLTLATILNGLGYMQGLGPWFVPVTLLSLLGTVGIYLYKGYRLK
jgi:uncharacterized membrane protein